MEYDQVKLKTDQWTMIKSSLRLTDEYVQTTNSIGQDIRKNRTIRQAIIYIIYTYLAFIDRTLDNMTNRK